MTVDHHHFLREAIRLAREGLAAGNPPFGSVIVLAGEIRVKAFNSATSDANFLLHGEMNCLLKAREILTPAEFAEGTIYATGEPCPMCCGAIYWSGIRSVVYGASRESLTKLRRFGLNTQCRDILEKGSDPVTIIGPICESEVMPLYEQFYRVRS